MPAAKSLLASVVVVLAAASAALADEPTVRISHADQMRAEAALLRQRDFGVGWTGGPRTPSKLTAPDCPGFDPKESDLVVTGHAEARFTYARGLFTLAQDTQVLASRRAVAADFARTIGPKLAGCLAHQLKASGKGKVVSALVRRLPFPRVGDVSAAYRAVLVVRSHAGLIRIVSDHVFFGQGRIEHSLNVVAPAVEGNQLVTFEAAIAQILVKRGATDVA